MVVTYANLNVQGMIEDIFERELLQQQNEVEVVTMKTLYLYHHKLIITHFKNDRLFNIPTLNLSSKFFHAMAIIIHLYICQLFYVNVLILLLSQHLVIANIILQDN